MQTKVVSVRFDAQQGLYHGRVDVVRDGRTLRYPCRIEAPESAPTSLVERALSRQALRMSQSDRPLARPSARQSTWAAVWATPRTAHPRNDSGLFQRISDAWSRLLHPLNLRDAVRVRADVPRRPRSRLY
jgi:hypothetical protein